MLTIPATVTALFKTDSVRKNFRAVFPNGDGTTITNADIVRESVRFTESICSRQFFRFGLAEASVLEFETVGVPDMRGKTIAAYSEIDVSSLSAAEIAAIEAGTWDGTLVKTADSDLGWPFFRVPLGTFVVASCPRNHEAAAHRKVTAYSPTYFAQPTPFEQTKLRCPIGASGQVYVPSAAQLVLSLLGHDSDAPLLAVGCTKSSGSATTGNMGSSSGITVQVTTLQGDVLELQVKNAKRTIISTTYLTGICGVQYDNDNIKAYLGAIDAEIEGLGIDYTVPATVAGAVQVPIASAADIRALLGRCTQVYNGTTYGVTGDTNGQYDYIHPYYAYRHSGSPVQWAYDYLDYSTGGRQFTTVYIDEFRSSNGQSIVGSGNVYFPHSFTLSITDTGSSTTTTETFTMANMPNSGNRVFRVWAYAPPSPEPPLWNVKLRFEANGDAVGESNFVGVYDTAQLVNDYLELLGAFASPSRAGDTEVFHLNSTPQEALTPAGYRSFWWDEYSGASPGIIRFSIMDNGDTVVTDYTFGTGTSVYDMSGNKLLRDSGMTPQQACAFLDQYLAPYLEGLALDSAEADLQGLPYLESGDCVQITGEDGTAFHIFVTRRELAGVQSLVDSVEAVGNDPGDPK